MELLKEVEFPFSGKVQMTKNPVKPSYKLTDEGVLLEAIFKGRKSITFKSNVDLEAVMRKFANKIRSKQRASLKESPTLLSILIEKRRIAKSRLYYKVRKVLEDKGLYYHLSKKGEKIIVNTRSAGKFREVAVNMQHVTHGSTNTEKRAVYFKKIKQQIIAPNLGNLEPFEENDYPLKVVFTITRPVPNPHVVPDLDNLGSILSKTVLDYLQANGTLRQDDIYHVNEIQFKFVESSEKQLLNIKFYKNGFYTI